MVSKQRKWNTACFSCSQYWAVPFRISRISSPSFFDFAVSCANAGNNRPGSRMENSGQIEDLGIREYFEKDGVTVIEWADRLGDDLPDDVKSIVIEPLSETQRKFTLEGFTPSVVEGMEL